MFISNIGYIFQSTTPFTLISFVLLLAAIIFVAVKCPAKLHSIGTLTMVFGLLCFSLTLFQVYECIQWHLSDCDYQVFAWEKMMSGEIITREDFNSVESIWKYICSPVANCCAILLWSTFDYTISRILYIIRTPRI